MSTVLILGAASDMAVAIAKKYASKGYHVQLAARNTSRLQALQSDIGYPLQCSVQPARIRCIGL